MPIREILNRRGSTILVTAAVLGAVGFLIWEIRIVWPPIKDSAYFTMDDGKTLFVAKNDILPPFKDGVQAAKAHVYLCDGKQVIGYISRLTPHAIDLLKEVKAAAGTGHPPPHAPELPGIYSIGTELKKPGDAKWINPANSGAGVTISSFKCPDVTNAEMMP